MQDIPVWVSIQNFEQRVEVVLPALADDALSGFENIMDQANAVLREMVTDGAIAAEERARMVLRAYP